MKKKKRMMVMVVVLVVVMMLMVGKMLMEEEEKNRIGKRERRVLANFSTPCTSRAYSVKVALYQKSTVYIFPKRT